MKKQILFASTLLIAVCITIWFFRYKITDKHLSQVSSTNGQITFGNGDIADMPYPSKFFVINDFDSAGANLLGAFRANQTVPASSIQPLEGYAKINHESGKTDLAFGVIGNVEMNSPAAIGEVRPIHSGGVYKNSGSVDKWKSFYATVGVNKGTGTITNGYGFYMDPWPTSKVIVKNKWGVYINDVTAANYFGGEVNMRHLSGNSATPKSNVLIPFGTVSVTGNDISGEISFSTSQNAPYKGKLLCINFDSPYPAPPKVILTSANENAPLLISSIYVTSTTNGFILNTTSGNHRLLGLYKWNYMVVQ